jgi:hypothetical protein
VVVFSAAHALLPAASFAAGAPRGVALLCAAQFDKFAMNVMQMRTLRASPDSTHATSSAGRGM